MTEAIADGGHLAPDNENFEIDFDDRLADIGTPVGNNTSDVLQEYGDVADDFEFRLEDLEAADSLGSHTGNGATASADFALAELAVPQSNVAESEIGYEDEEPSGEEPTMTDNVQVIGHQQDHDENPESIDNIDEIDYEEGDDEATKNDATASHQIPAPELSAEQETPASVLAQQVLGDAVASGDAIEDNMEAEEHDGSTYEPSVAGRKDVGEDNTVESATSVPASEVSDVLVLYNGVKYELCASVHNDDPETYFFAGTDEMDRPLSQFFGLLRDVIKDELEPSDDLVIKVGQLKLEFGEESSQEFLDKFTFRNILDLYRRFRYNDGDEDADHAQLVVQLIARPNCNERFAMLLEAADAGRGWSEFFDNSDSSDTSSDDVTPHEGVDIVEEASFYDDTEAAGDPDVEPMFDDQAAEHHDQHHADDMDIHDEVHEAGDQDADNDEFDQGPEDFETAKGDQYNGTSDEGNVDSDNKAADPHANASDTNVSVLAGTPTGGSGRAIDGNEAESFDDEAAFGLDASNTYTSGNDPPSFVPLGDPEPGREEEWLDQFLEREYVSDEEWKTLDALALASPTSLSGGQAGVGDDRVDYVDDDEASTEPSAQSTPRSTSTDTPPPIFPRRYGILDVPSYSGRKPLRVEVEEIDDSPSNSEEEHVSTASVGTDEEILPSIERDEDDLDDDNGGILAPAVVAWLIKTENGPMSLDPSVRDSLFRTKHPSFVRKTVCKYTVVGTVRRNRNIAAQNAGDGAGQQADIPVSPGLAASGAQRDAAVESPFASFSSHGSCPHSDFALNSPSIRSGNIGANLSDIQAGHDPTTESYLGVELGNDSIPNIATDEHDDSGMPHDEFSTDIEGFAAFEDTENNESLAGEAHNQGARSQDTSASSTVNGDEITYEDDDVPHGDGEAEAHEAGDNAADNLDEIDWENDGDEDAGLGQKSTNQSSPSGLSVKRARGDDDVISLDDETAAKRQKL